MLAPSASSPALELPLRSPRSAARTPLVTPELEVSPRFTADGSRELEQHLAGTCRRIAAGVRGLIPGGKLEALLLGGGYGRGEGGVLRTATGDKPYNDLEFYVCIRGNRHLNELRFGHALHVLGEILTPQAGIEVEFKITSLDELAGAPVSMFSYDLLCGHRLLAGDEQRLADCAHHREAEAIPLSEATRLLMNRFSGLLFAEERLRKQEFTAADADFTRRNIAKAQLALGDAMLTCLRQYHWSVRERHRRIERLSRSEPMEWMPAVREHHAVGVAFKLHPERSSASREELRALHAPVADLARQVFLWTEEHRLGCRFPSPASYAVSRKDKCPGQSALRNLVVSSRTLGLRPVLEARAGRHPRERVLHAMALLLWDREALTSPDLLVRLQSELQTRASRFNELMTAYRKIWSRVN